MFTLNPNGFAQRDSIIHGTISAPNGIAFKTTRDVSVRNERGQNAASEIYVFNGSDYERIQWSVTAYDDLSHPVQRRQSNGTISTSIWNGDILMSETSEAGIQTDYTYDALSRVKTRTKKGVAAQGAFQAQPDIITTYEYDAENRTVSETTSAGSLNLSKTSSYDLAGRIKRSTDERGLSTLYDYTNGGRTQKVTSPGGANSITDNYFDGQPKSISGSGVVAKFFDYGVAAGGIRFSQEFTGDGGAASPRWEKTFSNWMGDVVRVEKPSYISGAALVITTNYNNKGQKVSESFGNGSAKFVADTVYEYNELGELVRKGLDTDNSGNLAAASSDRIEENESSFEKAGSDWFRNNIARGYLIDNNSTAVTLTRKERLTFPAGYPFVSENISIDENGQPTTETAAIDRAAKKQSRTLNTPDSSTDAVEITVNGLLHSSTPTTPETALTYSYDALGRAVSIVSPKTGTLVRNYSPTTGQVVSQTQGDQTTNFDYYPATHQNAGKLRLQTNAEGKRTYFEYDQRGNLTRTWGNAVYPLEYVYDAYNQKAELHTFRAGKGWQLDSFPVSTSGAADVTKWSYHEPTGLLNSKEDAAGKRVVYQYDGANRPQRRIWARLDNGNPVQASYIYLPNTGEVSTVDYSDATPDVTFGYDRGGRVININDAAGSHALNYNTRGELTADTVSGGILNGVNLSIGYDALSRRSGLQAAVNDSQIFGQSYTYDASSRYETITANNQTVSYGYYPASGLLKTTAYANGTNTNRVYDTLGRVQSIVNTPATDAANSYTYTYNKLNQRTKTVKEDNSYWGYTYNDRGEVESGKKFWADNSLTAGQQFEFGYDNLGNRQLAKTGGDASGANLRQTNYETNGLNQYVSRANPGAVDIYGTANASATITVNNQPTARKDAYFHAAANYNNSGGAVYTDYAVSGVKQNVGSNGEDAVEEKTGKVYLPPAQEAFTYDADGNLLSDGRWQYAWDAENRLASLTATGTLPEAAKRKLEFAYDFQGRRIQKKVFNWDAATAAYQLQSTTRFIYDGWNLIAELDANNALTKSYVWGQDVSGSLQEAGGIGGLLLINTATDSFQTGYDANGNLTLLTRSSDGKKAASYDYDPFGNITQETGASAEINRFRFSTKYTDLESNLIYYGYRYYNPQTGRWLSRDPIGEDGGINLNAFVSNDGINKIDKLGMYEIDVHYYLTYYLALQVGCFSNEEARQIAEADQMTDQKSDTLPGPGWSLSGGTNYKQKFQNSFYHALSEDAAPGVGSSMLWEFATKSGPYYEQFGEYLHYLQDTFSHQGFTNTTWGHTPMSWLFTFGQDKGGTHATDKTGTDPLKTLRMAKYTFAALGKFANVAKCGCKPKPWNAAIEYDVFRFALPNPGFPFNQAADIEGDVGGGIKSEYLARPLLIKQKADILNIPIRGAARYALYY